MSSKSPSLLVCQVCKKEFHCFRLEERSEDGSGKESTLEVIAERQKELRVALLGMEAQVCGNPTKYILALHKFPRWKGSWKKVKRLREL